MYRIGIYGSENSHAKTFARIFNGLDPKASYPDIQVVAVGGDYPEESRKMYEESGLEYIVDKPEDMLGKVDAAMITARNGKFHPDFSRPFIEAGIPCFIDKPFADRGEEALEIARLAKRKGVPVLGGSSVKYAPEVTALAEIVRNSKAGEVGGGDVAAPINMHNDYGDFYFYSAHLAEVLLTVFGFDPSSVSAFRNGDNLVIVTKYDKYLVTGHYIEKGRNYSVSVYGKESFQLREISQEEFYRTECAEFARMLRTEEMHQSYEELVLPVYYLNAIDEALRTGKEQPILKVTV